MKQEKKQEITPKQKEANEAVQEVVNIAHRLNELMGVGTQLDIKFPPSKIIVAGKQNTPSYIVISKIGIISTINVKA